MSCSYCVHIVYKHVDVVLDDGKLFIEQLPHSVVLFTHRTLQTDLPSIPLREEEGGGKLNMGGQPGEEI